MLQEEDGSWVPVVGGGAGSCAGLSDGGGYGTIPSVSLVPPTYPLLLPM